MGGANTPDDQGQGGVAAGLIKSKVKYNFLTGGEWGLLGDKINFQGCQTSAVREAILQKIPEFYEIFHKRGARGSTGFHISYSEIVNDPKSVGKSE